MRRKFRRFLLLFGTGAVLVLAYCVIKRDALMLAYLVNTSVQPRQLSERRLRPAFELITGHPLPQRVESLQGIFRGGHEPSIFLRFASDSENIGRFLEPLVGPGVDDEKVLTPEYIRQINSSGHKLFYTPSVWQARLKVQIFDQESIHHGRLIDCYDVHKDKGYKLLIDEENNVVYCYAYVK